MAKRRDGDMDIPDSSHGDAPAPSEQDQPAYNPFLKAPDVSPEGETFKITEGFTRRKSGRFGEQIIMEVVRERDGKIFDFGIGIGSMNHRVLARRMGDERVWRGSLKLKREQGNRSPFVAVAEESIPF